MINKIFLAIMVCSIILIACKNKNTNSTDSENSIDSTLYLATPSNLNDIEFNNQIEQYTIQRDSLYKLKLSKLLPPNTAKQIINQITLKLFSFLSDNNFDSIANYIHPTNGLAYHISEYRNEPITFARDKIKNAQYDKTKYCIDIIDGQNNEKFCSTLKDLFAEKIFVPQNFKNNKQERNVSVQYNRYRNFETDGKNAYDLYDNAIFITYNIIDEKGASEIYKSYKTFVFVQYENIYYWVAVIDSAYPDIS